MKASKQKNRRQRRACSKACGERRAWRLYLRQMSEEALFGEDIPESVSVSTPGMV